METLRIALSGYGRMGKEVEKAALAAGHRIACRIDNPQDWEQASENLKKSDVVIDFSSPSCVTENISRCYDLHLPVVVGTTGWDSRKQEIEDRCRREGQSLLSDSNFSIGVHLFLATAGFLAALMEQQPQYEAAIEETHHVHKLDKPSGTAISLARKVLSRMDRYDRWEAMDGNAPARTGSDPVPPQGKSPEAAPGAIPVKSFREGETVGIHNLLFESGADCICLRHQAKSRQGFALGAIRAAEWLIGRKGAFSMADMLGF